MNEDIEKGLFENDIGVIIYEDEKWYDLYPISLSRPTFDIRVGALTILEKWKSVLPVETISVKTRDYLEKIILEKYIWLTEALPDANKTFLLINGRTLPHQQIVNLLDDLTPGAGVKVGDEIAVALLDKESVKKWIAGEPLQNLVNDFLIAEGHPLIYYLWNLIHINKEEIISDMRRLRYLERHIPREGLYQKVLGNEVYTVGEPEIGPFVTLDSRDGPIVIFDGTKIQPNVYIQGPAIIGKNSLIKASARIYEGTTIGPVCKVAGEIEESIFIGYSNKQHHGFLGHAYVGEWVNIGAGTTNSDLKNNYSTVKVTLPHKTIDTGLMFVGSFIGDHVKIGIQSMLNTGTVIGIGTNLFGGGFPPKFIPSFVWGGENSFTEHQFEKFLETARQVMGRRKIEMTPFYEFMLRTVFDKTKSTREEFLKSLVST